MKDPWEGFDAASYLGSMRHPRPVPVDPNWPKLGEPGHCSLCRDRAEAKAFAVWVRWALEEFVGNHHPSFWWKDTY